MVKREKKEFLSNFFKDDNEDIVGGVFQLKQSLHEFLRCRIGNGRTASFCYDSWTELGPMGISCVLRNQCNFAYSGMDCFKSNTSWKLYFPPVHFLNAETTSDSYAMMCICGEVLLEISWTDSSPKWHGNGLDNMHLLFLGILRFGSSKKPQAVLLSIGQLCHLDFHLEIGCCLSVWWSWQVVFYVRTAHNLINISSSTVLRGWITEQIHREPARHRPVRLGGPSSPDSANIFKLLLQLITYNMWRERNCRISDKLILLRRWFQDNWSINERRASFQSAYSRVRFSNAASEENHQKLTNKTENLNAASLYICRRRLSLPIFSAFSLSL